MKAYSHHKIRLYLGFLITGAFVLLISFIFFTASLISQIPSFQPTIFMGLSFAFVIVGFAMILAYEEIQRWCSKGAVLDRGEFGIVGYDEWAAKWRRIEIIDPWEDRKEREIARAFGGKANGQNKVMGMDGGKGDGFQGGRYCWVRERQVEHIIEKETPEGETKKERIKVWQPYLAWSIQRGVLSDEYMAGKTTEQILADIERDEPFVNIGDKVWMSPYLFQSKTVIKPDPSKGIVGKTEIPLQVAEKFWNDPDWRDYSPVLWADDVKTMFGGSGSKLSSSDQFRLAHLEDETIDKTIAINRAQDAVAETSQIASSYVRADYQDLKKRGLIQ